MRGMVLAAGRGERMKPLTYRVAKPAIPALNRPLLSYGLRMLQRGGVTQAAVNTHHLPSTVEQVLKDWTPQGMQTTVFHEESLLGTAGGMKNAESIVGGDGPFFLSNGDFVFDVDLAEVLETHRKAGAVATMVLVPFQEHKGYAPVEVVDGRVVRIAGHPDWKESDPERYVFTGLHVVEEEALQRVPSAEEFDINRQLYPGLLADGKVIAAHVVDGPWVEFGTPGEYLRRTLRLLEEPFRPLLGQLDIDVQINGGEAMVVGDNVNISDTAALRDGIVLGNNVSIGREVKLRRSVIWDDAKIGYHSDLSDSIVGAGVILPPNSVFHHRIVLARGADLPETARGERQGDLVFFPL